MAIVSNANAGAYKEVNRTHGYMKPFWLEPSNKDVMGYKLSGVKNGDWIPQGYPVKCEDSANGQKVATLCKYCTVEQFVSTTIFMTKRNSLLKAGEKITFPGGEVLSTIKTIERAGEYDKVTLSAANTELTSEKVGVSMVLATAAGQAANLPNRVVAEDCNITEENATIVAAHSGIILKNVVKYPTAYINSTAFPGSDLLVGCPAIMFIVQ